MFTESIETLHTRLTEPRDISSIGGRYGSVRAVDSFVPLGPATSAVLVGVDQVVAAAVAVTDRRHTAGARS